MLPLDADAPDPPDGQDAQDAQDAPVPGDAGTSDAPSKVLFVTSGTFNGNLGGVVGADGRCAAHAGDAGLTGTFVAWISSTAPKANAIERAPAEGPWYLPNGTGPVFLGKTGAGPGFLNTVPLVKFDQTEHGDPSTATTLWTGTAIGGSTAAQHCQNWTAGTSPDTAIFGNAGITSERWTQGDLISCAMTASLLCLQR